MRRTTRAVLIDRGSVQPFAGCERGHERVDAGSSRRRSPGAAAANALRSAAGAVSLSANSSRVVRNGLFRAVAPLPSAASCGLDGGAAEAADQMVGGGVVADGDHLLGVVARA